MWLMREAARLMRLDLHAPESAAHAALRESAALCEALPFGYLTRPCVFSGEGPHFMIDDAPVPGTALARHLAGCGEGLLIGATLGIEADRLLKRRSLLGLTQAAAIQAALSAKLELELDSLCAQLETQRPGWSLTSRFSPGYGDLSLSFQSFMMEKLEMSRLGVHLTGGFMMAPVKSVTAIVGWRKGKHTVPDKCAACPNTCCPYRSAEAAQSCTHKEDSHEIS